jgi:hypothetical protein
MMVFSVTYSPRATNIHKMKGLDDDVVAKSIPMFLECPHPWVLSLVKAKLNNIMNINIHYI